MALTFEVICARLEDKIHDLQKHADPVLSILNSRNSELATNDDYFFADPYLVFSPPEDGDYVVQIRDVKYDGDVCWTYVLRATDLPRIAEVFPRVGKTGESLSIDLMGSAAKLQKSAVIALPKEPGIDQVPVTFAGGGVESISFLASDLPQIREGTQRQTGAGTNSGGAVWRAAAELTSLRRRQFRLPGH